MRAIEGYVSSVSVQGNAHDSRGLIASMAAHIKTARPLTAKVLERYVLLIKDIPGISVRTVLRPAGKLSGAATLDILVTHRTVTGYVQVDDHGSRAIGPLQGLAGINLNSPFGRDTMTGLQFATVNLQKNCNTSQSNTMRLLPQRACALNSRETTAIPNQAAL